LKGSLFPRPSRQGANDFPGRQPAIAARDETPIERKPLEFKGKTRPRPQQAKTRTGQKAAFRLSPEQIGNTYA